VECRRGNCHDPAAVRTDPRELDRTTHDLVVVGAGIQGAAIAREAAERGISTLLVDRRDVAAGTSSRSSRLVHGGLRYLKQGHVGLVREALLERERLLRSCPHLVRPLPMVMPFFRDGGGSPLLMRLGTMLYQKLAGSSTLPPPRRLTAREATAAFPGLRTKGLREALLFFDAATQDTRITVANALAAKQAGAHVVTHCAVTGGGGDGLWLVDGLTGNQVVVRARHVVNATGPRADELRRLLRAGDEALLHRTRGSHLVLAPRSGETAIAAFLPDGRIQFVIPHRDGTLCGTTDVDDPLDGDETGPPAADVDYLLEALGFLLDPAPSRDDVRFAYCGWRSLPTGKGPPGAKHREAFVVDEGIPLGHLHTIVGGKLTTHRSFAERVVARIFGTKGPSPTRTKPLPGGLGPREVTDELWWRHGGRVLLVRDLCDEDPTWGALLCPHRPFLAAELVHALRHDGAVTFSDAMVRRLVHTQGPCVERTCLRNAHSLFLRERKWSVDIDPDAAIDGVRREVAVMRGESSPVAASS